MDTFDSLISSAFHYSSPAYINMSEKNWQKVENFYCRSLKCCFDLPSYMSSQRARELFKPISFRQQIEDRAVGRITVFITTTCVLSDMVYNYENSNGKDTIMDRTLKIMGVEAMGDCNFCAFDLDHHCVKSAQVFLNPY